MLRILEIVITEISGEWASCKEVNSESESEDSVALRNFSETPKVGAIYYLILSGSLVKGIAKKLR